MSTLILTLPFPCTASPEYDFVALGADLQPDAPGRAGAALLPAPATADAGVVALLPAAALSWHLVSLPAQLRPALLNGRIEPVRRRALLSGVLEEQLLEDPERLHFAVFAGPGEQLWVAVCERQWLSDSLKPLEAAGYTVTRLLAEFVPRNEGPAQALLCGGGGSAQWIFSGMHGVTLLPQVPAALVYVRAQEAQASVGFFAEPAQLELAEQLTGASVQLQTAATRWVQAAQSSWNLAQGEFNFSSGGRWRKRLLEGWQQCLHAPQWRPLRWGLLALLLVQLLTLNSLAWVQRAQLAERRAAVAGVLTQTFPDVAVVVDAPLQMQRAVDALALSRGQGGGLDLGRMLAELGPLATEWSVRSLDVRGAELRLQTEGLTETQLPALVAGLASRGIRASWSEGQLTLEFKEAQP